MRAMSIKSWHIPFSRDQMTLRQGLASLAKIGSMQQEIPLMIQLVENPQYDIPGFDIFHGAVDIRTHDCIHILLGRGLLTKDEAFTIGFTMGSTNRVSTLEETLFALISKYLYPKLYRFDDEAIRIFKDAVKLAFISDCQPLNRIDYSTLLDWPLRKIRKHIGIEKDLLRSYYRIEKKRYPKSSASGRLLD